MQTKDNQITPQIYYRPLHQWLKVTPEQKQEWERFVGTIRKSQQRANACCIPYKKSYKCDGVCEGCEFRHIPENAPQCLSIESEMEYECSSGTRDSFLADNALITEISIDSMFLRHLLAELRESDPESHQILMMLAEGLSERAGAEQLHMPRNTFVYKKNGNYTSAGHNRELLNWYRCKSRHNHTAVEVPRMMYTPPSRYRVDDPSPAMVAYREKYNRPTPPRKMICSDIRIPFSYPQKVLCASLESTGQ